MQANRMQGNDSFDVVIVGAGLVGAALALGLREARVRVALVDPALARDEAAPDPESWDARVYAISPASVRLLDAIGAWREVDRERLQACERMEIRGDARDSMLEFSAWEIGEPALAWIVESRELSRALFAALRDAEHVVRFARRPVGLDRDERRARLSFDDGTSLDAALVVGADGAGSWLRDAAGLSAERLPYGQQGVVANFSTERRHGGVAWQWFRGDSVLAWLPLAGPRMSMVWSCSDADAATLLALDPASLCARVGAAGEDRLGHLELVTAPRAFPLARVIAPRLIGDRVALVGDAAHVVHPLAGQGVNLGFGDVASLVRLIGAREQFRACGDGRLLRRYERERREDILAMRSLTHGLDRLFALPGAVPRWARNAGLDLTQRLPGVKAFLARHALG